MRLARGAVCGAGVAEAGEGLGQKLLLCVRKEEQEVPGGVGASSFSLDPGAKGAVLPCAGKTPSPAAFPLIPTHPVPAFPFVCPLKTNRAFLLERLLLQGFVFPCFQLPRAVVKPLGSRSPLAPGVRASQRGWKRFPGRAALSVWGFLGLSHSQCLVLGMLLGTELWMPQLWPFPSGEPLQRLWKVLG